MTPSHVAYRTSSTATRNASQAVTTTERMRGTSAAAENRPSKQYLSGTATSTSKKYPLQSDATTPSVDLMLIAIVLFGFVVALN